jgi:transposase-like protein
MPIVHYARNLLGMVGFGERGKLAEGLRGVFAAPSRELALRAAEELADRWRRSHPKVAEHIEEHIEECLERAWLSQRATGGASAPPTAWRGSTRR